jgi:hypothetical protein
MLTSRKNTCLPNGGLGMLLLLLPTICGRVLVSQKGFGSGNVDANNSEIGRTLVPTCTFAVGAAWNVDNLDLYLLGSTNIHRR